MLVSSLFVFKDFICLLREGGREGEREGGKHQCVVASHGDPTGDLARNPGMCPDSELNWRLFDLQACAQFTELPQPGVGFLFKRKELLWRTDLQSFYGCGIFFLRGPS